MHLWNVLDYKVSSLCVSSLVTGDKRVLEQFEGHWSDFIIKNELIISYIT